MADLGAIGERIGDIFTIDLLRVGAVDRGVDTSIRGTTLDAASAAISRRVVVLDAETLLPCAEGASDGSGAFDINPHTDREVLVLMLPNDGEAKNVARAHLVLPVAPL